MKNKFKMLYANLFLQKILVNKEFLKYQKEIKIMHLKRKILIRMMKMKNLNLDLIIHYRINLIND